MANAGHARLKTATLVMGDDARRTSRECSAVEDLGRNPRWMSAWRLSRAPSVGGSQGEVGPGLLLSFQGGGSCSYSGRVVEEPTQ